MTALESIETDLTLCKRQRQGALKELSLRVP